jgi:hypothetical protein
MNTDIKNHQDVIAFIENHKDSTEDSLIKKNIYLCIYYFDQNQDRFSEKEKDDILDVFLSNSLFFSKINTKNFKSFLTRAIEKKEPLKFYNANLLSFKKNKNNEELQLFFKYFDILIHSNDQKQFFLFFETNTSLIKKNIHSFLSKYDNPIFRKGILKYIPSLVSTVYIPKQEIISLFQEHWMPYQNIQEIIPQFHPKEQFILISRIADFILQKVENNDLQFSEEFELFLKNPLPFLQYWHEKNPTLLQKFLTLSDQKFPQIKESRIEKNIAQSLMMTIQNNSNSSNSDRESIQFIINHYFNTFLKPIHVQIGFLVENFEIMHYFNHLLQTNSASLQYFYSNLDKMNEKEKKICLIGFFDAFVDVFIPKAMYSLDQYKLSVEKFIDFNHFNLLIDCFGISTVKEYYQKSLSFLNEQKDNFYKDNLEIIFDTQKKIQTFFYQIELQQQLTAKDEQKLKVKI